MRIAVALLLLVSSPLAAQSDEHAHHHAPGSAEIGEVRFPSTCAKDAANDVQTGVALLHSFWYDEAEKTFRRAIASDDRCAIAYWGVAIAQYYPLWPVPLTAERLLRGREALEQARKLESGSPRERAYIDTLSVFYQQPDGTTVHDRAVKYEDAMARLVQRWPDDHEAAIFYALALNGAALLTDKTHARQKHAAEILNGLLPSYPRHPGIIHYLIHSYDSPELAPLALHMPWHIFTRLGLWDESIASNLQSEAASKKYGEIDEQLHAMDYLEYAYLQLGRFDDARKVVDELAATAALRQIDTKTTYAVAAIPARYALERHDWLAAAAPGIDWNANPRTAALTQFAIGIGAARSGNVEGARRAEETLTRASSSPTCSPR